MSDRTYSMYNPEYGLACTIIAVVLGVTPIIGVFIALIRSEYLMALACSGGAVVALGVSVLLYRAARSDAICLSETGLERRGGLTTPVTIEWKDVCSFKSVRQHRSFRRRSNSVTTWIVRGRGGQVISISGFAADAEEIARLIRERLPQDVQN